jgi:hypothetical protein
MDHDIININIEGKDEYAPRRLRITKREIWRRLGSLSGVQVVGQRTVGRRQWGSRRSAERGSLRSKRKQVTRGSGEKRRGSSSTQ